MTQGNWLSLFLLVAAAYLVAARFVPQLIGGAPVSTREYQGSASTDLTAESTASMPQRIAERQAEGGVLVVFSMASCMACQRLAGVLPDYAELPAALPVIELVVDDYPDLAQHFAVQAVPSLHLLQPDGSHHHTVGYQSLKSLTAWVDSLRLPDQAQY